MAVPGKKNWTGMRIAKSQAAPMYAGRARRASISLDLPGLGVFLNMFNSTIPRGQAEVKGLTEHVQKSPGLAIRDQFGQCAFRLRATRPRRVSSVSARGAGVGRAARGLAQRSAPTSAG